MSAKDQIKQIVDYFKREPQLKDKTDGMAEGLLLGANLADEANERSKDAKETTLAIQEKYKEQILTQDLNPNKDPELVDIRDGSATAGERIRKFEQETNRQLAQIAVNAKTMGAVGDGVTNDTEVIQYCLDNYEKVGLPIGTYLVDGLVINPWNILVGFHKNRTTIKSTGNGPSKFVEIKRSSNDSSLLNLTIDSSQIGANNQSGVVLSNDGLKETQDTNIFLSNLIISGFLNNLQVESEHRGLLATNIRCDNASRNNFDLRGTDNEYISCVSSTSQEDGIYIGGSNNRLVSCKSFLAGRGLIRGAGINLRGSFNTLTGCESQENRLCNLYMYNANNCIVDCVLDGAGAHVRGTYPDLTYNDVDFDNKQVYISFLRLHNCKNNDIKVSIVNGRTVAGEQWRSKAGIFSLYPKLDVGNVIHASVYDETTDGTFEYRKPKDLYYAAMNRILFNSLDESENHSIRSNFFNAIPYETFGNVAATDRKLTLSVDASNTNEVSYTYPLNLTVRKFVYGQQKINGYDKDKVELITDVALTYFDTNDTVQYKNTSWMYPSEGSVEFDINALKKTFPNFKYMRSIRFRVRGWAKNIEAGKVLKIELINPTFLEQVE